MREFIRHAGCFAIDGALTADECRQWIQRAERIGFSEALINGLGGQVRVPEVRNNDRVLLDDADAAAALYERLKPQLPEGQHLELPAGLPGLRRGRTVGVNERLRLYRYHPGQQFNWHRDGSWSPSPDVWSVWTVMVYLNEEFEGGGTGFVGFEVTPRTGTCLVFLHELEHCGAVVTRGVKYVLRTDLMVRAV